jgi:multidrug efflux pump subunit AcrA (membrane-fusion protein)
MSERPTAPLPRRSLRRLLFAIVIVIAAALLIGAIPRYRQNRTIRKEAEDRKNAVPVVTVTPARRSAVQDRLTLPGTIAALVEAPIYARATGYIAQRKVDIGDRVRRGQLLAVIDSPDLDRQVEEARATVSQAEATVGQMEAQLKLATVTRDRYNVLVIKGVLSRQEGDTQEANYEVAVSNLNAAKNTVNANIANLNRLIDLQRYERITAPFDGVITARNVDIGSFIATSGAVLGSSNPNVIAGAGGASDSTGTGTEVFRMAAIDRLRIFVSVPESYAPLVKVSEAAEIDAEAIPEAKVAGRVTRTADAIDPNTRTLLTEIQIDNRARRLLPGMYVLASLLNMRAEPPVAVPSDSLITRAQGPMVALVRNGIVHLQPVRVGRDYGPKVEILDGVREGELVVMTPGDETTEGARVRIRQLSETENNRPPGPGHNSATNERYEKSPQQSQTRQKAR